eukprot:6247678-Prymnesium_polylepis.1
MTFHGDDLPCGSLAPTTFRVREIRIWRAAERARDSSGLARLVHFNIFSHAHAATHASSSINGR